MTLSPPAVPRYRQKILLALLGLALVTRSEGDLLEPPPVFLFVAVRKRAIIRVCVALKISFSCSAHSLQIPQFRIELGGGQSLYVSLLQGKLMRTITLFLCAALAVTSIDAAWYQKTDGTIWDPIQGYAHGFHQGDHPYSGNNLEPLRGPDGRYRELRVPGLRGPDGREPDQCGPGLGATAEPRT